MLFMEKKKKSNKTMILTIIIVLETIVLLISLAYSTFLFAFEDGKTKWFEETSPDGQYKVTCFTVGSPLFFDSQDLEVHFLGTKLTNANNINDIYFKTALNNDGATLRDENYSIQWLEDSVKIVFRGQESGGDNIYVIPYYK